MDVCGFLIGFTVAMLLIAVIGHLIWITLSAIVRAITGRQPLTYEQITEKTLYRLFHEGLIDAQTLSAALLALNRPSAVIVPRRAEPMPPPVPSTPPDADTPPQAVTTTPADVMAPVPPPVPPQRAMRPTPAIPIETPPALSSRPEPRPSHPPRPPKAPARPWSEMLASFMKEANIRWGELVGGLLVVGCSIALVRTFWSSIADQTWMKLGVFTAITAAVFAVGLYTEHRWKLPTTSRAILIIASLLVPLTFFAVLVRTSGRLDGLALGGTFVATALLGFLLYLAGRVLTPESAWAYAAGVLGASAAQIVMAQMGQADGMGLILQGSIPLAFYVGANAAAATLARRKGLFDESFADRLMLLLGVTSFAMAPAIRHLVGGASLLPTLRTLAPLFPVAGAPALAIGILLWNRLTEPQLTSRRIAGTAIAVAGLLLLLAGVAVAYPHRPASILCGVYALAAFVVAYITARPMLTWAGAMLLLGGMSIWPGLDYTRYATDVALVYASICAVGALASLPGKRSALVFLQPLLAAAMVSSLAGLLYALDRAIEPDRLAPITRWHLAIQFAWASGIWLLACLASAGYVTFAIFQALLSITGGIVALAIWNAPVPSMAALRDGLLGVSAVTPLWPLCRLLLAPLPDRISHPAREPGIDGPFAFVLLAGLALIALVAIFPGAAAEFARSPRQVAASSLASAWTWLLAALVVLTLLLSVRERPAAGTDLSLLLTLIALLPLAAAHWNTVAASASAWRWLSAGALLGVSLPWWLNSSRPPAKFKPLALLLALIPILGITIYAAESSFLGHVIAGPRDGSFFARLGAAGNYLPPLIASVVVLVVHAIKDHSPGTALAGGLVLNLSAGLAYALRITTAGIPFESHHLVRLLQLLSVATSVYLAAWLLLLQWRRERATGPLAVLLATALLPMLAMIAWGESTLLSQVSPPAHLLHLIADGLGLPAAVALMLVCLWTQRCLAGRIWTLSVALLLLVPGALIAMAAADHPWIALHLLLAAHIGAAWALLLLGWLLARSMAIPDIGAPDAASTGRVARLLGWQRVGHNITLASSLLGLLVIALALLTEPGDPTRPAWCLIGILSIAALAAALAVWTLRGAFLSATGILLNLAVMIWWQRQSRWTFGPFDLLYLNILALAAGGLISLAVELFIIRPLRGDVVRRIAFSWHALACILATLATALLTLLLFGLYLPFGTVAAVMTPLSWATLAGATLLAALCLYDEDAWCAIPSLYVLGLAWIGQSFDLLRPVMTIYAWHVIAALGGYSLLVALLYNIRATLLVQLQRLGVPARDNWPAPLPTWLIATTLVIAAVVATLAIPYAMWAPGQDERLATSTAAICMAVAIGLLGAQPGRTGLKKTALLLGAAGAVLWSMGWVDPGAPDTLLNRMAISMVALALAAALYGAASGRILDRPGEWARSAMSLAGIIGAAAGIMLFAVLVGEITGYRPAGGTPIMAWPAFIAVALALIGLSVAGLICAFKPALDPLKLSDRARTAYVYFGQAMGGILFLHARMVHPEWFGHGFFVRYWPLILLLVSFTNAGVSEWLHRRGQAILAEPFTNIGAVAPIAVVAAFLAFDTHLAVIDLTLALLLAGMMYASLAISRKSFIFSLLAVLAANGALWKLLSQTQGLAFSEHPQLWLIPVALSVLAAAWLNRERLAPEQLSTVRYVCLMVVYLSSTADVWINRDQTAIWLPLVLAVLAVAGVVAGIAMRVQSFLFLGSAFALVAVAAMIRIAARQVHGNWPWLVAGILLGAVIVVTFALFEKKKTEMVALIDRLKEWQH